MLIDEKTVKELNTWNDNESLYKQFEKKCAILSEMSGLIINPSEYQLQYDLHVSSMDEYINFQTELYGTLYEKYKNPDLEFGMSGRLKSPFSHYEKVIRKFIELFRKDEIKPVEILDDYAIKIFIMSVNYHVDKIAVDSEGIYIDSGADEFRINDNHDDRDIFVLPYQDSYISIPVEVGQSNIFIDNTTPYITAVVNGQKITLPLNTATEYKRSKREDLISYCQEFQKDVEKFYNSKGFTTKKRKDYISQPKPSGYASCQCIFYSEEENLGIECQIRTYDMEKFNNYERAIGYKPDEKQYSSNSLKKIPKFALTTRFEDGFHTYTMTDSECFEYIFDMPLQEYRKKMKLTIKYKDEDEGQREDTSR